MTLQGINRSSLARRWFGVLMLLAFSQPALLAPGFMLASVGGRPQVVMCPAGLHYAAAAPSAADMPPMAGMHHASGLHHVPGPDLAAHGAHGAHAMQQCPYAQAGGAGFAQPAALQSEPWFIALRTAPVRAGSPVPADPPLRHRAPRGPPTPASIA